MKKLTKFLIILILPFIVFLLSCFVEVSFNIKAWDETTRVSCAFFMGIVALIGFIVVFNPKDFDE